MRQVILEEIKRVEISRGEREKEKEKEKMKLTITKITTSELRKNAFDSELNCPCPAVSQT
jgi:hypothetical protein